MKLRLLLGIVIAVAGCENGFFAEPAREPSALNVSYSLNAGAASAARAFDKADRARVRLLHAGSVVLDTVVAFTPAGEVRIRIPLDGPETPTTHTVEVHLLRGTDVLFRGSIPLTLEEGEVASVQVELVPVVTTQIAPLPPLIAIGDTATIRAVTLFATGDTLENPDLTFSTTNPNVLTISSARLVRVVGEGTAQITVNGTGVTGVPPISVTVTQEIASITLPQTLDTLGVGDQHTFTATLRDRNGNVLQNRSVAWFIQDTTIAANVGGVFSGTIVGKRAGSTLVHATTAATAATPSQAATLTLLVKATAPAEPAQVTVSPPTTRTLLQGETQQFSAAVRDASGNTISNANVRWFSSNTAAVTIDSISGLAVAVTGGVASISARAGNVTGTATATVCGSPPQYSGGLLSLFTRAGRFRATNAVAASFNNIAVLFGGGFNFGTSPEDLVVGYDARGTLGMGVDPNAQVCVMDIAGGRYTRANVRVTKPAPVLPLLVTQETFSTGGGFILVRYTFKNQGTTTITGLRSGLVLDPDLMFDNNAINDRTRFNAQINASEAFETGGQVFGAAGVGTTNFVGYSATFNQTTNGDPTTLAGLFDKLAPGISTSTDGPADIRQYLAFGELSVAPGQSVSVSFAFAAGNDVQEYGANVANARATAFPNVPGF